MKSNTNHGIHSPFVYDLITTCFFSGSWTKEKHFITSKIQLKKKLFNLIRKLNNYVLRYNVINKTSIVVFNLSLISKDHKEIEYLSLNNHQFIIIIENSHNFRVLVKSLENKKKYIIIDFYFWTLVVKIAGKNPENFKIRIV